LSARSVESQQHEANFEEKQMLTWIVVVVLYVAGMGLFHILGGLSAAGEAIENWGRASAADREEHVSPSSC
jgi:hypothetical protein